MPKPLAVLNIEDSESDSKLIASLLKKADYKITFERVETAAQMRAALKKHAWDIVISECGQPQFDGYAALALLQEMGLDIPFIAVSGTSGDETIVGMMKAGAHDYLMKNNLTRLVPVIERELEQAEIQREHKRGEESARHSRNLLLALSRAAQTIQQARTPEEVYHATGEQIKGLGFDATVLTFDNNGKYLVVNHTTLAAQVIRSGEKLLGLSLQDYRLPISPESIYGRIVAAKKAEYIHWTGDLVAEALPKAFRPLAGQLTHILKIGHGIIAPLHIDEVTLGILTIGGLELSKEDLPAVDAFAAQVAISLRNVRLTQHAQEELTARRQAEDALLASESSLQGILQSTADGILAVNMDNKILFTNEHFVEMWKIPQEVISIKDDTILLQHVLDQLTNPQEFLNKVQELYKSQQESFDNLYFKDGRVFERLSKPLMNGINHTGRVWSFRDITERKQMESALLQSEQAHRTLFENVPVGLYRTTADGRILDANPALAKIFGFQDRTSLMKMKVIDLYADPATDRAFVNEIKGNDSITNLESKFRRRDGTIFYAEDNIHVIRDEHGNPLFYEGSLIDITERKQAEEVALESEVRYRNLFEDSPVSLWEEDFSAVKIRLDALREEGIKDFRAYFASHPQVILECIALVKIVNVNKATLKLFGTKGKADLLQNLSRFVDSDAADSFQHELINIAQGKSHFEWEGTNQTLDGRQIVVKLNLSTLPGYEDSMSKVIISMIDITAHMHAEKAIRESERSLRESQMIAGLGSYILDIPAEKWTSSDILNQIFGIDEAYTHSTENWLALIHPDWRQEMSDYFANEVLGKHIRFEKEYKIVRKNDGAERWVHGLGKLEFNAQNQPVKMRGTIQDITERKRAEEALRRAEEKYRNIFENSLDGIFQSTPAGRFITVNPALARMWGYDSPEDLVASVTDIANQVYISPDIRAEHMRLLKEQGGNLSGFEYQARRKDGSVIWVSENVHTIQGADGALLYYEGTVEDISTRKQAEETLRESEANLNRAQAVAHTGSWKLDVTRNILAWSAETYRVFGVAPKTPLTYESFLAFIHPEDLELVDRSWQSALQGAPYDIEHRILVEQQVKWVRERAELESDADGNILRGIGTVQDITERKQAEETLEQRARELQTLYETSMDVHSQTSLDTLLSSIVERAASLLDTSGGGLYLMEPHGQSLKLVVGYNLPKEYIGIELRLGEGLPGRVAQSGKPINLEDYQTWPNQADVYKISRFRRVLGVPLKVEGKVIGVINVSDYERTGLFSEDQVRLVSLFADQAALAIDHARLYEQEHTRRRELDILYDSAMTISSNLSLEVVLKTVAEQTTKAINIDGCALSFWDQERDSVVTMVDFRLVSPDGIDAPGKMYALKDYPATRRALETREPLLLSCNNPQTDQAELDLMKKQGMDMVLLLPLVVRDQVIGLMELYEIENKGRIFTADEIRLAHSLSIQTAIFIENARLYQSVQLELSERKRVEESLRESEQRYRALFEDMPVSIWEEDFSDVKKHLDSLKEQGVTDFRAYFETNPEAFLECGTMIKVLDVNQATLKMYHADSKDDLYKNMDDGLSETEVEHIRDALIAISEGKTSHSWEGADITVTGEPIEVSLSWTVAPDHENDFSKVIVTTMDITARKRAEAALRESEQRYRALFEDMPIAIWEEDFSDVKKHLDSLKAQGVTDFRAYFASHPDTAIKWFNEIRILDVNNMAVEMFRAENKEQLIRYTSQDTSIGELEHANEFLTNIADGKTSYSWEGVDETMAGEPIEISLSWSIVPGREADFSKAIVTTVDITERKRTEEALRTSEEKYRLIIENAGEALYVVQNGLVVFANPMFEKIAELPAPELIGKSIMEFIPAQEDRMAAMKSHLRLLRGKIANAHMELKVRLRSGAERWIDLSEVRTTWEGEAAALTFATDITERKQAEEALRTSEERFKTIFEQAPLGIASVGSLTGHIYEVNPRFAEIAGRSMVEMANIDWMQITHPDDVQADLDNMALLNAGKINGFQMEKRYLHPDGTAVWINMTIAPLKVEDKAHPRHLCMIEDITERKQSEDALQKSEKRFRALIANAGDLIVVIDTQGIIQFASPSSERILGYEPEEAIGINFTNWIHPDDLSKVLESLASRSRESGVALESIKTRGRHKNGSWRILDTLGTSLINEPAIQGIVLNIRDITERELTEEALRASESQFRAIFEGAAIGIALVDASGHAVKNNSALQEMLGYDAQELHNMAFTEYTHPDDVTTNLNQWQELIAGKHDHYQIEKRFIHKSGRIIWVKLTSSAVVSHADGKMLFSVGMVEDITERKLREREQEALASITQAINQGLDLDLLLQNLLDAALHAVPLAEKGAILLLDAEDTLRIRALSGYLDPRIRTASFPSTSGYSARAVRECQPLIIADARADTPTRYNNEIEEMGAIQSAIVAPLIVQGRAIGAISLDNASRKEAFGGGELTMLSTFASSAALVIQNSRLLEETRQRVAELELLYESGLAISQLLNPKEIGQKIIDLLGQKMNWHHTAIRLYNVEDKTLELLAFHQPDLKSEDERLAMEARFKSMVSHAGEGLSGWVIQHGETVRSGNLINDDRYVETFAGLHSGLYIPIKTGERIVGVISIESEKENAFSKSDEQLTTILATQAASIFENARLYEEIIQRATELEQRVTERTTQIEATKRRLELATHAGQIGVWEYNPRENKVIWDERMYVIHQIPAGEFDGTSQAWARLIHPHDLEKSQLNKQLGFTQNLLLNDEHRILWPDGSVRHIMSSAVTAYSPEGIPERIIGINMDITERKQIEQSLRESETYARLLFDAVPDPVSVTEADGSIVDVNKVFEKEYGLVRDEIRGRRISEFGIFPETELDKRDKYLSEILQGQSENPVELQFNAPGDHIHTLELHSYLLKVNDRQLMLNTSHDITEYKKAEEIQRLAKSEMEHALRIKNEFLANMSHELRTPLNSILGISESLEEQIVGALNEKQLKYIGVVRESGRHLLELINDVLDLSKIEAGRMELDIRHISVEKFCQSSLRMIKELAQKKSLNVSYKANGDVKIILGDERRLKQCLVNLLINAVKFSPPGSRIGLEVNGHSETNEVTFTVWDHGIGIAQKDIQHLFKPFVQLDAGLTREFQGTGLGLALVAQMVHLHGGSISVESEAGKGSRFIITLPWLPSEQTPGAKVTAELSFPSPRSDKKRTGKILLVEDTDLVIQLVSDYLRYKGYEVILAHNGVEGVKLAAQEHPDLILMDVMMPIMDGLEATQKIRTDETLKNTPIVALTALAMSGDKEKCLAAGMNDYLSKPIQMQDLADMIEKYLGPAREDKNEQ